MTFDLAAVLPRLLRAPILPHLAVGGEAPIADRATAPADVGAVTIGVCHRPPWLDLGGDEPEGPEAAALAWIADRMDLAIRWLPSSGRSLRPVLDGQVDVMAGTVDTAARDTTCAIRCIGLAPLLSRRPEDLSAASAPVWMVRNDWHRADQLDSLIRIYTRLRSTRRFSC